MKSAEHEKCSCTDYQLLFTDYLLLKRLTNNKEKIKRLKIKKGFKIKRLKNIKRLTNKKG